MVIMKTNSVFVASFLVAFIPLTKAFFCSVLNYREDFTTKISDHVNVTEPECKALCSDIPECVAAEYDSNDLRCGLASALATGTGSNITSTHMIYKYCEDQTEVYTEATTCFIHNLGDTAAALEKLDAVDVQECANLCKQDSNCFRSVFNNGNCWKRGAETNPISGNGPITFLDRCSPFPCQENDVDFPNNNLETFPSSDALTVEECYSKCSERVDCAGSLLRDSGECVLKSKADGPNEYLKNQYIHKQCPSIDPLNTCIQRELVNPAAPYQVLTNVADELSCQMACENDPQCLVADFRVSLKECSLKNELKVPLLTKTADDVNINKFCPKWSFNAAGYNGYRYIVVPDKMPYTMAASVCQNRGFGELADILDQQENAFVKYLANHIALNTGGMSLNYFIGVGADGITWNTGQTITYADWCSTAPTLGPVHLKSSGGYCWQQSLSDTYAGAICKMRQDRKATKAEFINVESGGQCYYISRKAINPFVTTEFYGTYSKAEQMCRDIGAELAVITTQEENDLIMDLANCLLSQKETVDTRVFDLSINHNQDTFSAYDAGHPVANDRCTQLSGLTGLWKTRNLEGCLGQGGFADDKYKTHVVCKASNFCEGQWDLLLRHSIKKSTDSFTSNDDALTRNNFDIGAALFSRLSDIENYRSTNGDFHFRLAYPDLGLNFEWRQSSDPTKNAGTAAAGFEDINLPNPTTFQGLGMNDGASPITFALADFDPTSDSAWFAIGAKKLTTDNKIPGPESTSVEHVELHVSVVNEAECFNNDQTLTGGSLLQAVSGLVSAADCQKSCQKNPNCLQFIYDADTPNCDLLSSKGSPSASVGFISGPRYCGTKQYPEIQSCGSPSIAPSSSKLAAPTVTRVCPSEFITYQCDAGGLNVLYENQTESSFDVECGTGGNYLTPTIDMWPTCIASLTCQPLSTSLGTFSCDDDTLPAGAKCSLLCNDGYLPSGEITNTCLYNNQTDLYMWEKDPSLFSCVPQVGVLIGGFDDKYNYLDTTEIFAPSIPTCHGYKLRPFPTKVIGAVTGRVNGYGVVCGGALMKYIQCTETHNGMRKCQKNAQYVSSLGGSKWYTGPKSKECYFFDHAKTFSWAKAVDMFSARAYASSVSMPDGTMWIMGGAGEVNILNTIEIIGVDDGGSWYVRPGPARLTQAKFGHCSVLTPDGSILLAGGFDGNDYTSKIERLDELLGVWRVEPSGLKEPRFDHVCKATVVRYDVKVIVAGGWNENGVLNSTEILDVSSGLWTSLNPPTSHWDLRRSASVYGENGRPVIVGGVSCGGNTKLTGCKRQSSALEFVSDPEDPSKDNWKEVAQTMAIPRSSHALLSLPRTQVCS